MHSAKTIYNNSINEKVSETYNKTMEKCYPQYKPQKHWRKEKRPRKHNYDYNYNYKYNYDCDYDRDSRSRNRDKSYNRDRSYSRDRSRDYIEDDYRDDYGNNYRDDYRNDYRGDCRKENHRDFKHQKYKRKYRDNYENTYGDRYNKDNHRNNYKNKDRNKNKDQHRDDSYDQIRGRSKEKECWYDDRKDDSFEAKLKKVHKILQTMSKEKEIVIALMLVDTENLDHIVYSIHSQWHVDHWIAERIECAKSQKAEKLAKDQHENISNTNSQSNVNPVNCETINLDTSLTQDLQENVESIQSVSIVTTIFEGKVDDYPIQLSFTSPYEENIQNIDIYDVVEMPDIPTRIADDQVIEEFMLEEEEINSQGIDECKTEKLQDIPIEVVNEQDLEEIMQEEVVSDMTWLEIYRVDERIHTDVQLEIPIIKSEEGHIVQDEPKLVQDKTLICAIPNPLQTNAQAQHMTEQKISIPERANIGKIILDKSPCYVMQAVVSVSCLGDKCLSNGKLMSTAHTQLLIFRFSCLLTNKGKAQCIDNSN